MTNKTTLVAPTVVLSALLLTACGGGGKALTKAQFVSQANMICKNAASKIPTAPASNDADTVLAYTDKLIGIESDVVANIKKLNPPKADKKRIQTQFYDSFDKSKSFYNAHRGDLRNAIKAKDQAAFTKLTAQLNSSSADSFLKSYGLTDCSALGTG